MAMVFVFAPFEGLQAKAATISTANYAEMLARAEAITNYKWTPLQDIATWKGAKYKGETLFKKGTTVRGMPYTLFTYEFNVDSLLSLEQYQGVVAKNRTVTAQCVSVNAMRTGPLYGSCCATFVSEVLGGSFMSGKNPRYDSVTKIQESPYAKHIFNAKASQIQVGDALSTKTNASHVIWVGGITDTSIIIYEQTPPVARRVVVDKATHIDENGYFWYGTSKGNRIYYKTINRVNIDFSKEKNAPTISNVKITSVNEGEGYTVTCKVTDDVGAVKVQFPSWSAANGQDDLAKDWEDSAVYAGEQDGTTYTYTMKVSDHKKEFGNYQTHIYAWDGLGHCSVYTDLPMVEVKDHPTAITTQPKDMTADEGQEVRTYVEASGTGLTYQWQLSDDGGKTWRNSSVTKTYYATNLTAKNDGRYLRCIVTDQYGNKATSKAVSMRIKQYITITEQPQNVTGNIGDSVTTSVKAAGDGLSYQWQLSDDGGKTWRNSAAQSATYTTTLSSVNNGRYLRCVITDKDGHSVTSKSAVLSAKDTIVITTQPADVTAANGSTVTVKVTASGVGLSYGWQLSDDQGKTWRSSSVKTSYYATTLTEQNNGRYLRCIITNQDGHSVTSDTAVIRVKEAITITAQPKDITGHVGDSVKTSVKATGEGLSYQWQLSDDAGKTWRNSSVKTSYYATTLTAQNNGRYLRCMITDKDGNKVTSNTAVINIKEPITITAQPHDIAGNVGNSVTTSVKATGEGLSYQWQLSDDKGTTWRSSSVKTTYYATTLTAQNSGRYLRCIITDKNGNKVTSDTAVMKIK